MRLGIGIGIPFHRAPAGGAAYAHNMVVFDGTADALYRFNATHVGCANTGYTVATKFALASAVSSGTEARIITARSSASTVLALRLIRDVTGLYVWATTNTSAGEAHTYSNYLTGLDETEPHTYHVAHSIGTQGVVYVDGVDVTDTVYSAAGTGSVNSFTSADNDYAIGATITGVAASPSLYTYTAMSMGFVFINMGTVDATASHFYDGGDVEFHDGADWIAAASRPQIFFGGNQTAANWNAGTNLGTLGEDYMMSGGV